jgi:hypothetical protein
MTMHRTRAFGGAGGVFVLAANLALSPMGAAAPVEVAGTYPVDTLLNNPDGYVWAANGDVTIQNGKTVTLGPGVALNYTLGNQLLSGGAPASGTFAILGTFNHDSADQLYMPKTATSLKLQDGGTYRFSVSGGSLLIENWNPTLHLLPGGTVEVEMGASADTAAITCSVVDGPPWCVYFRGGTVHVKVGRLTISSTTGRTDEYAHTGAAFEVASSGQLLLNVPRLPFRGTYTGSGQGRVVLTAVNPSTVSSPVFDLDDGADDPSTGGIVFPDGGGYSAGVLVNRGKLVAARAFSGFLDTSLVIADTGRFYWTDLGGATDIGKASSITIQSGGQMVFTQPGTFTRHNDWGGTFAVYGTLRAIQSGTVTTAGPGAGKQDWWDIRQGGTVTVAAGATLEVDTGLKFDGTAIAAGAQPLDCGAYLVSGNLDLDGNGSPGTVGAGKFTSIGASATVKMIGPNASFDALSGTFAVRSGQHYVNTAAALTVNGGGTLEFGLNAWDTKAETTSNAYLRVNSACTIRDGAQVKVEDAGGLTPGEYLLVKAGTLDVTIGEVELVQPLPEGIERAFLKQDGNSLYIVLKGKPTGTVFMAR